LQRLPEARAANKGWRVGLESIDPRFTSQATLIGYEHQKSTIDADSRWNRANRGSSKFLFGIKSQISDGLAAQCLSVHRQISRRVLKETYIFGLVRSVGFDNLFGAQGLRRSISGLGISSRHVEVSGPGVQFARYDWVTKERHRNSEANDPGADHVTPG
jgi:hypothetical protein